MDGWVEAPTVEGPWNPAKHEPTKQLDKIRQAAETNNQNQPLGNPQQSLEDAYKDGEMPAFTSAPLLPSCWWSKASHSIAALPGTTLSYVSNTGCDIFVNSVSNMYYVLLSGRWFSTMSLQNGPWTYVPGASLPVDFSKIPVYSPKADVLVSIPGTPQAKEAVIANSIPQTATISRTSATLTVTYEGAPVFQPIAGTSMTYAVNSAIPVIYVPGNTYYAVNNGVWFIVGGRYGTVGGSDIGSVGDLYHPAELARSLRDLRSGLRIHAERGLCRLHAGILRHGGLVRRRRRLRNRLLLSAIHRPDRLGAGTVHLRRGRDLCLEHHRRMGARLWHGHGDRILVQSVVGTGRLLGMGLGSSGLGMGRLGRRCRR